MQPTYCYSWSESGGLSMHTVPPGYTTRAGEFISLSEPASDATLEVQFPAYSGAKTKVTAYLASKRQKLLNKSWKFNVASPVSPEHLVTTRLNTDGFHIILKIHTWTQLNAGKSNATLFHSNDDASQTKLTLAEAQSLVAQAIATEQAILTKIGAVMVEIASGAITTAAQVDSSQNPPWPVSCEESSLTNILALPQITISMATPFGDTWGEALQYYYSDGVTEIDLTGIIFTCDLYATYTENAIPALHWSSAHYVSISAVSSNVQSTLSWLIPSYIMGKLANAPSTLDFRCVATAEVTFTAILGTINLQ